jgi:hypothetical protein
MVDDGNVSGTDFTDYCKDGNQASRFLYHACPPAALLVLGGKLTDCLTVCHRLPPFQSVLSQLTSISLTDNVFFQKPSIIQRITETLNIVP